MQSPPTWTLTVLHAGDESQGLLAMPPRSASWYLQSLALADTDPASLRTDLLLLALSPFHPDIDEWLGRFRLLNPICPTLLIEAEEDPSWYRRAIRLGVDDLLPPPRDDAAWRSALELMATALATGAEQRSFVGRLERSTHSIEESRRKLAETLLSSYENLGHVHKQLTDRLGQLSTLYQLGRDLSQEANWDGALEHFLNKCVKSLDFNGVALLLWGFGGKQLSLRAEVELPAEQLEELLPLLKSLEIGARSRLDIIALREGELLLQGRGQRLDGNWDLTILPLVHGGEAQGFLVYDKNYPRSSAFESDFHFLKTVQTILGEELANAKAVHLLKRLDEFNRTVLESVHTAVLAVDGLGHVSYRNSRAERLFGEHLRVGLPFAFGERFHPVDGPETELGELDWIQRECRFTMESGEPRHVLLSATTLAQRHERDIRYVIVCEDFTEYKRLERELRKAEHMSSLGQLSAGMAHEIRNPLAGIATTAQVLQGKLGSDSIAEPFLCRIQDETQRLEKIVRSLLDFSRPILPSLGAIDLQSAAGRALADLAEQATAAGIEIEELAAGPALSAWADRDQIQQVLINLLLNAIQACNAGDRIGLRLERAAAAGGSEGRVRITVYDTGPGVPDSVTHQLFDPFFTTKTEGTGLGLTVCQKIMDEHGGRIHYRAREGGGSEFTLDLAPAPAGNHGEESRL